MIFDIYNPYSNQEVTSVYVDVLKEGLKRSGHETSLINKIRFSFQNKKKGIVVITAVDSIVAKLCGYNTIFFWSQGVVPEESFMRNHSVLRLRVISIIEKLGLKNASFCLLVSDAMKRHYERKYHLIFRNYYIMPCFNEQLNRNSFFEPGKYENNVFVYAGGTSVWQCFEKCFEVYSAIEKRIKNSHFRILVRDTNYAIELAKKYNIQHYSVDFVSKEEVQNEMRKAKFGFCIRDNDIVNNVSTPTKLSSYIAHGVIPITTTAVRDFASVAKRSDYCIFIDSGYEKIMNLCSTTVDPKDIWRDYFSVFNNYYSKESHIHNMVEAFKVAFE